MKIIDDISQWINDYNGIFTFCLHSEVDERIYDEISKQIFNKFKLKSKSKDVSYIKSLSIKNSIFEFNSKDILSKIDYETDREIIRSVASNCHINKNVVLWKEKYSIWSTNTNVIQSSQCVFEILNGKMSLKKFRQPLVSAREYKDIDMMSYIRDIKISEILD